jgi:hypothetical protein
VNKRNSILLDHVVNALISNGDKAVLPGNASRTSLFNHATNLKRKLKREWNKKPWNVRHAQRLGIIRTLVAIHEGKPANG